MTIEIYRVYTFEECAEICQKNEYYFRTRAQDHRIRATATDPNRPWMKAIIGIDLIKYMMTKLWGKKLLKKYQINIPKELLEDEFRIADIDYLEKELKELKYVEEKRFRALEITRNKIKLIEEKLRELKDTE